MMHGAKPRRRTRSEQPAYGSANRFGAWPPPNSLGKSGAITQAAELTDFVSFSPPLGLQSKLGKIPDCADCRPLSESGCG